MNFNEEIDKYNSLNKEEKLLEAMVFQNKILDTDKKEKLKKIEEKLKIQLNIEKKEKEKEKIELEKLLNF